MNPNELLGVTPGASAGEIRVAYLRMARRWHPDRFAPGPERMWAEDKMIAINQAYAQLASEASPRCAALPLTPEQEQLNRASELLKEGRAREARGALSKMAIRNCEWNYLFGATLMRQGEYHKAAIYFSVAANQRPDNETYRAAYHSAQVLGQHKRNPRILRIAGAAINKTRRVVSGILK